MKAPLFRTNPRSALEKATAALAADGAKIAALEAERDRAVGEFEGVEILAELDDRLSRARKVLALHGDRIAALRQEVAKVERQERLEAKAAAITVIEETLARKHAAAVDLQAALGKFADALGNYVEIHKTLKLEFSPQLFPQYAPALVANVSLIGRLAEVLGMKRSSAETLLLDVAHRAGLIGDEVLEANKKTIDALKALPLPGDANEKVAA